jgi:hypothetical protein
MPLRTRYSRRRPEDGRNENNSANKTAKQRPNNRSSNSPKNASGKFEKYVSLARDAFQAGDLVAMENFYQHAEHYYRMANIGGGSPATSSA